MTLLLFAILTGAVFGPALNGEFLNWDDNINIINNPGVRSPTVQGILSFWRAPYEGLYIPVVYTVWTLLSSFSGPLFPGATVGSLDPALYHGLNLLTHFVNALLVYFILLRLLPLLTAKGAFNTWAPAVCGGLFFLLHPVQVEPVAWVTGFKDLSAAFFSLLTLLLFLKAEFESPRRNLWPFIAISYGLALLSKPSVIVLPLILILFWYIICERWTKRMLLPLGLLVLSLPLIWLTMAQQPGGGDAFQTPLWLRPVVALDAIAFYIGKIFLPITLAVDYARDPERLIQGSQIYWTWTVPLILAALAVFFLRRHWKLLLSVGGIFLLTLLPVLGFIYFNYQDTSTVADRYQYFALLAPALGVGFLVSMIQNKWVFPILGIFLVVLGVKSHLQTYVWSNSISLFEHNLRHYPESKPSRSNLASAFIEAGEKKRAKKLFREQIKKFPDSYPPYNGLAKMLVKEGKLREAAALVRQSLALADNIVETHALAGEIAIEQKRFLKARRHLDDALRLDPYDANALYLYGNYYAHAQKNCRQAVAQYRKALNQNPSLTEAHNNSGNCFAMAGAFDRAEFHFKMAAKLNPDMAAAHINLGRVYLAKNNLERAYWHLKEALKVDSKNAQEAEVLIRRIETQLAKARN